MNEKTMNIKRFLIAIAVSLLLTVIFLMLPATGTKSVHNELATKGNISVCKARAEARKLGPATWLSNLPFGVPAAEAARLDCASCFENVNDDVGFKRDVCNQVCAESGGGVTCYRMCQNAYDSSRCQQMQALCKGCTLEIAMA
jgi:hypothetical protein